MVLAPGLDRRVQEAVLCMAAYPIALFQQLVEVLTFVAAALGIAVVLLSRGDDFTIIVNAHWFEFRLHVSVLVPATSKIALTKPDDLERAKPLIQRSYEAS